MSLETRQQPISIDDPLRAAERASWTQFFFYAPMLPAIAYVARQIFNMGDTSGIDYNAVTDFENVIDGFRLFASGALMFGAGEVVEMTKIDTVPSFKFVLLTIFSACLAAGAAYVSRDVPVPFVSPEMIAFTMHGLGQVDKRYDNLILGVGFAFAKNIIGAGIKAGKFINRSRN